VARLCWKINTDASAAAKIGHLFAAAGETAARAAERFTERAGDDVDLAHHTRDIRACHGRSCRGTRSRAPSSIIVRASYFSERSTIDFKSAIVPSIEKTAVGRDQTKSVRASFLQLRLEVGHVVVFVAKALRFTEPDAVDDRRVIQFVTDDGVFFGE